MNYTTNSKQRQFSYLLSTRNCCFTHNKHCYIRPTHCTSTLHILITAYQVILLHYTQNIFFLHFEKSLNKYVYTCSHVLVYMMEWNTLNKVQHYMISDATDCRLVEVSSHCRSRERSLCCRPSYCSRCTVRVWSEAVTFLRPPQSPRH